MIIVAKRLNDAFKTLPAIDGKKPTYRWGNKYHLLKQLEMFQKDNKSPYPLIYQTSNESDQDNNRSLTETRLSLVIAVRNTKLDALNENRWPTTFEGVLYPVAENIITLFQKSGIFLWDGMYSLTEFPNYGNGEENYTIDLWDALLFETTIKINNNCIQTFKY